MKNKEIKQYWKEQRHAEEKAREQARRKSNSRAVKKEVTNG